MNYGAWESPIYRQTVLIVLGIIFLSGFIVFLFRRKTHYFTVSWASIKSWLIAAPILFGVIGAPEPWPLVILTLIAILGAKIFFQIFGMYQKALYVWCCYLGIIALAFCVNSNQIGLYNLMPMIVLGTLCLLPIIQNVYQRVIQYTSLTLLAFVFMGWSFMHLGLILKFEKGIYQLMYLIILTEFCDNTIIAISRSIGSIQIASHINPKRYLESTVLSIILTLALASAMRYLLPDNSENYWLASGLIAALGGGAGDLVMTVIRRDLGIRDYGAFIIGRGDFLHRMDRLIFVAPIYYYFVVLSQS